MPSTKLIIGLTGGIGSGKSTVANLFAERGAGVIDTDQLSRDLTQPNTAVLKALLEKFGPTILTNTKELDRKKLREIIFADSSKRIWLEELLHPLIRQKMQIQAELVPSSYCIVVIPLLFETKPNPLINRILVVDTPEDLQISRTLLRDKNSIEVVKAIMKTQISREKRRAGADDIIINDNEPEHLIPQVDELHKLYTRLAKNI